MPARRTRRPHKRDLKVHYKKYGWWRALALMPALLTLLALAFAPLQAGAAPMTTTLALDVKGKITKTNDADHTVFHFSEAQILALPTHTISTSTTWTAKSTFTGPLLADILKTVGAY